MKTFQEFAEETEKRDEIVAGGQEAADLIADALKKLESDGIQTYARVSKNITTTVSFGFTNLKTMKGKPGGTIFENGKPYFKGMIFLERTGGKYAVEYNSGYLKQCDIKPWRATKKDSPVEAAKVLVKWLEANKEALTAG